MKPFQCLDKRHWQKTKYDYDSSPRTQAHWLLIFQQPFHSRNNYPRSSPIPTLTPYSPLQKSELLQKVSPAKRQLPKAHPAGQGGGAEIMHRQDEGQVWEGPGRVLGDNANKAQTCEAAQKTTAKGALWSRLASSSCSKEAFCEHPAHSTGLSLAPVHLYSSASRHYLLSHPGLKLILLTTEVLQGKGNKCPTLLRLKT